MERESREMTLEMKEAYKHALEMDSYIDGAKCAFFQRSRKVSEASYVSALAWNKFWSVVSAIWPDTATHKCSMYKGYNVLIEE